MAVACHRKALLKVVIIGSAQDVPIGSNYHVATSQRTKSRKLEKADRGLLRDREPCAGCHHHVVAVEQSCQWLLNTRVNKKRSKWKRQNSFISANKSLGLEFVFFRRGVSMSHNIQSSQCVCVCVCLLAGITSKLILFPLRNELARRNKFLCLSKFNLWGTLMCSDEIWQPWLLSVPIKRERRRNSPCLAPYYKLLIYVNWKLEILKPWVANLDERL